MWRLSTRLAVVAVIASVIPAAMGSWSLWQHYKSDRAQAAEQVGLLAQALAGEGGRIMGGARQLLDVLATFPSIKATEPVHCTRVLKGVHDSVPQYAVLAVADPSGHIFCSSRPVPSNASALGLPWFERAQQSTDGFAVSDYTVGELTGKPVLQFSLRTSTTKGEVVILAALDLNSLSAAFSELDLPPDTRVNVIDRAGRLIYRYPEPEKGIGLEYPDKELLAAAMSEKQGIRLSVGLDNVERIVAFQPLSKTHDTGIVVTAGRARDAIQTPARRDFILNLVVLAIAVAVATSFAWFGAGLPVSTGIRRLAQAAASLTAGQQDARVGPVDSSVEIHELATSFDLMAETLAQRQTELESALERLETSTNLARIGIFDWDVQTNTVVWNRQHFYLFGYEPRSDEASLDAFMARLHPDDVEPVLRALATAQETGEDYHAEYRIVLPSGETRWVLGIGRFTYDDDRKPLRMRGVLVDVTDRRKAEESLRRIQKMDALGLMTGGIAHDINNILAIISTNLQLMELRPTEKNLAEGVNISLSATERGADLVRRLLAFSRLQPEQKIACDIRDEVAKVKPLIDKTLPKHVALGVYLPEGLWPAMMASGEFGDALLNLALNATQAMPKGGRLQIEASNTIVDHGGLVAGPDLAPGEYVVLAVSDDGNGIPAEDLEKVFEPFFTTKERGHGSGLGLAMVYGFARRSGGTARIYSEVGRGTTVRVYLPRAVSSLDKAPVPAMEPVPFGDGATVLIVDDEPGILRAAEAYLRDLGYRTLVAERPAEALALFGEVGRIDLLFSDIVMSGMMTGIDLANRLRETQPDLKVLLTTGFADGAPGRSETGHEYPIITKPYRLDELARRIRNVLDNQLTART